MRLHRTSRKEAEQEANPKPFVGIPKKSVVMPEINTNTKTNMKEPNGLKYKFSKVFNTVPSYVTRDTELGPLANSTSSLNGWQAIHYRRM